MDKTHFLHALTQIAQLFHVCTQALGRYEDILRHDLAVFTNRSSPARQITNLELILLTITSHLQLNSLFLDSCKDKIPICSSLSWNYAQKTSLFAIFIYKVRKRLLCIKIKVCVNIYLLQRAACRCNKHFL